MRWLKDINSSFLSLDSCKEMIEDYNTVEDLKALRIDFFEDVEENLLTASEYNILSKLITEKQNKLREK